MTKHKRGSALSNHPMARDRWLVMSGARISARRPGVPAIPSQYLDTARQYGYIHCSPPLAPTPGEGGCIQHAFIHSSLVWQFWIYKIMVMRVHINVDNTLEPFKIIFTSSINSFIVLKRQSKYYIHVIQMWSIHRCGTKNLIMNGNKFIDVVYCFHSRASARKIFPFIPQSTFNDRL